MNKVLICFFLGISLFFSCKKEPVSNQIQQKIDDLTIDILSPNKQNNTFNSQDSVLIDVLFADKEMLHDFSVLVLNKSTADTLVHFEDHTHGNNIRFNEYFQFLVNESSSLTCKAIGSNHRGLVKSKEFEFIVNP